MFNRLSLGTKINLLLVAVFAAGILLAGLVLGQALGRLAEREVSAQGQLLISTMNAVRSYTSNHISPLLADELATSPTFISETVPAFSARTVFETVRDNEAHSAFFYKEAAPNPTNPVDLADAFEAGLVRQFQQDPTLEEVSGFRTVGGERLFYSARPLAIPSESCLECHSTPEAAPDSLIATFGAEGGFGWSVDQIVAAQVIYVPQGVVAQQARSLQTTVMGIGGGVLLLVMLSVNLLLRREVLEPVGHIAHLAGAIADDRLTQESLDDPQLNTVVNRPDELGQLAGTFLQMAREVYAREARMKHELAQLRIEIDAVRRQAQVTEITETPFFQELKDRSRQLRAGRESEENERATGDDS